MTSNRTATILISSVYLFTPLIFYPGELVQTKTVQSYGGPSGAPLSAELFQDMVSGKGGPEIRVFTDQNGETKVELIGVGLMEEENPFNIEQDNAKVRVTRTVNQLKVANTSWPVEVPDVSSDYGWRTPPCNGCSADHRGIDFVPGYGEKVMAVADGLIVDMGYSGGYGNYVRIEHLMTNSEGELEEWETLYAHMKTDSFPEDLRIGSAVRPGDKLGEVGSTGVSTGPHLHFELLINGEHVDPLPLLGTYQILEVVESEIEDHLFLGELITTFEQFVKYE